MAGKYYMDFCRCGDATHPYGLEAVWTQQAQAHTSETRIPKIEPHTDRVMVPYDIYAPPRRQFGQPLKEPILFSLGGYSGVSLGSALESACPEVDDGEKSLFEEAGMKITYVVKVTSTLGFW